MSSPLGTFDIICKRTDKSFFKWFLKYVAELLLVGGKDEDYNIHCLSRTCKVFWNALGDYPLPKRIFLATLVEDTTTSASQICFLIQDGLVSSTQKEWSPITSECKLLSMKNRLGGNTGFSLTELEQILQCGYKHNVLTTTEYFKLIVRFDMVSLCDHFLSNFDAGCLSHPIGDVYSCEMFNVLKRHCVLNVTPACLCKIFPFHWDWILKTQVEWLNSPKNSKIASPLDLDVKLGLQKVLRELINDKPNTVILKMMWNLFSADDLSKELFIKIIHFITATFRLGMGRYILVSIPFCKDLDARQRSLIPFRFCECQDANNHREPEAFAVKRISLPMKTE